MPVPRSLDEITPAWLTETLRSCRAIDGGVSVRDVEWERLGEGVGFIGIVARGSITYDQAGSAQPQSLIVKLPTTDEGARSLGNMYGLYEREVNFYNDVAPRAGITVPRSYLAAWDAEAAQSLILLEDLRGTGTPGDQVDGCARDQAMLAIAALGRFHATWADDAKLATIPWLVDGVELVRTAMMQAYEPAVQPFMELFGSSLGARIRAIVPDLHLRTLRLMDEELQAVPMTVAHGDYRLDNLYFGHANAPYEVAVFDWQSPNRGWGAYDVAYFMSGSFPPDQRRAYEDQMIRSYHETFVAYGHEYPFERFFDDYRRSLLVYLAIFVVNGVSLELSNERAVALFNAIFERLNAAILDLDALSLLPSP